MNNGEIEKPSVKQVGSTIKEGDEKLLAVITTPTILPADRKREIWRVIRMMMEVGGFDATSLHGYCVKLFGDDTPSVNAILSRKNNECWEVGKYKDDVAKEDAKTCAQIMSDIGFDKNRRMEMLCEIMEIPSSINKMIKDAVQAVRDTQPEEQLKKMLSNKQFIAMLKTLSECNRISLEALKESFRMCGEGEHNKITRRVRGGVVRSLIPSESNPDSSIDDDDEMSYEESDQEIKRLLQSVYPEEGEGSQTIEIGEIQRYVKRVVDPPQKQ